MDENYNVAPDELTAEQEALQEAKTDEVKAKVIEKFGLDELEHESLIENLVAAELENRKKLSQAIAQKRKYREIAQKAPKPENNGKAVDPDEILKKAQDTVRSEFEQRDLQSLKLPENLQAIVKNIAKINGVSVLEAASDPYFLSKKEEYEKEQKTNEAAISRTNKSAAKVDLSPDSPGFYDVDLSTEEGQKEWERRMQILKKNQK